MTLLSLPCYSTTADYEVKVYPELVQSQYPQHCNALEISLWLQWQVLFFCGVAVISVSQRYLNTECMCMAHAPRICADFAKHCRTHYRSHMRLTISSSSGLDNPLSGSTGTPLFVYHICVPSSHETVMRR